MWRRRKSQKLAPEVSRLFDAIARGQLDEMEEALLHANIDVDTRGVENFTPIFFATLRQQPGALQSRTWFTTDAVHIPLGALLTMAVHDVWCTGALARLLEKKGDPFKRAPTGYSPLDAAGFGGCAPCARLLLKAGLDPEDVHRDGFNQQGHTHAVHSSYTVHLPSVHC